MGYKPAGGGGGGPSSYVGDHVLTVANAGQGAQFDSVQAAVNAAALLVLSYGHGVTILIAPGTYLEDVVIKQSDVHLFGLGGQGAVIIQSVTYTDATDVSLAAFNASGNPTLLVRDGTLTHPPDTNQIRFVEFNRLDNVTSPWVGDAIASVRVLGGLPMVSSIMNSELMLWNSTVRQAAGAAAGKGGLYAANCNYISSQSSWFQGGVKTYQIAGLWFDFVTCPAGVEAYYNTALPQPSDAGNYGVNGDTSRIGKLWLSGPDSTCGWADYMEGNTIAEIDIDSTSAVTPVFENCHTKGAINIAAGAAAVTYNGGRYMVAPVVGAGASFTSNPGFGS